MTTSQPFDLRLPTPGCHNDPERAGLDAKSVFDGMTEHLFFTLGKLAPTASRHDLYMALSYAVRDRLMMRYLATTTGAQARPRGCRCSPRPGRWLVYRPTSPQPVVDSGNVRLVELSCKLFKQQDL